MTERHCRRYPARTTRRVSSCRWHSGWRSATHCCARGDARRLARSRRTIRRRAGDVALLRRHRGRLPEVHRRPRLFDGRLLRERYGYRRRTARHRRRAARPAVLPERVGFDAFAIRADKNIEDALTASTISASLSGRAGSARCRCSSAAERPSA